MLVRVALDCDALKDSSGDYAAQYHRHKQLVDLVCRYGVIVLPADGDIRQTVGDLPNVNLRRLWQDALQLQESYSGCTQDPPAACLCRIQDCEQLRTVWAGKATVAAVDTIRALVLGVPEDQPSHWDERAKMEIVRFDLASSAKIFEKMNKLGTQTIQQGESRETIWQERFAPLVMHSRDITICD